MKLTKSQKIFSGVLGVAVVGLVVDQFCGDARAPVPRHPPTPLAMTSKVSASIDSVTLAPVPPDNEALRPVAGRLRELQGRTGDQAVFDAFRPSAGWIINRVVAAASNEKTQHFKAAHRLKAIVQTGDGGQALVDSRFYAVGQSLQGWKLVAVSRSGAIFSDGTASVQLFIETSVTDAD